MSPVTDGYNDESDIPTEEIYFELQELETTATEHRSHPDEPTPVVMDDAPGIRQRIAQLLAMLNDRGAPYGQ